MSRRASLPGADELFRATGSTAAVASAPYPVQQPPGDNGSDQDHPPARPVDDEVAEGAERERHAVPRRRARGAERRPTGRERHDEKITVYCSADELIDIERARLSLRGDYGIAVDRGRIVREAISLILEQFEAQGTESPLVRRLQRG